MSMTPRKTPQKDHIEWMKKSGYTVADMDRFWNENYGTNPVVTNLTDHGFTWRDMNLCVVEKLPTQKARDAEFLKKKEAEEKAAEEAARKEKEARDYYINHFEEIIIRKIDSGEKLTENELQTLVWEYEVEKEYGEEHRWTRNVLSVVRLQDRYFGLNWQKGLTELQENEFLEQPYEVQQIEKTIVVKEWVPINYEVSSN